MMPRPGVDFLHGPVAHGPGVVLALYGYARRPGGSRHVDALIPLPPHNSTRCPMALKRSATKTSNRAPSIERTDSKRRESSRAVGVVGFCHRCRATHTTAAMVPIRRFRPIVSETTDQSDVAARHEDEQHQATR